MRVQKAIKKIAALSAGATMLGATIMGAMAADLSQYPEPFVKNGRFNGVIVVGDQAKADDVLGSIDIATSLQYSTKVAVPAGRTIAEERDVPENWIQFSTGSDILELGEQIGDVRETLTEFQWEALRGGVLVTDEGSTDYNQYLRFKELGGNSPFNSSGIVVYEEDEDDNVGDFLRFRDGTAIFEYELEFEEGFESEVDTNAELDDLEDEQLNVLGQTYEIVDTDTNLTSAVTAGPGNIKLTMFGGSVHDRLDQDVTKEYVFNGQTYKITAHIFSGTTARSIFTIEYPDGTVEESDEMRESETDTLKSGLRLAVSDIFTSSKETVPDSVEFFFGANKIEFTDTNTAGDTTGAGFTTAGTVEVDDENIEDAKVEIVGSVISRGVFELQTINYRLEADGHQGDVYIPPGHGIREYLDEPQGMLNPYWDIRYEGLTTPGVSIIKLNPQGDDAYNLAYTSVDGFEYTDVPFVDNSNNNQLGWKYGDEDDDLVFHEPIVSESFGPSNATFTSFFFNIDDDDYFVVSDIDEADDTDDTAFSHVLRYDNIDTVNRQLTFTDQAKQGGQKEVTYTAFTTPLAAQLCQNPAVTNLLAGQIGAANCSTGNQVDYEHAEAEPHISILGTSNNLVVGGTTYAIIVSNLSIGSSKKNKIAVDLDGNGRIGNATTPITVKGGGVLNLGLQGTSFITTGNTRVSNNGTSIQVPLGVSEAGNGALSAHAPTSTNGGVDLTNATIGRNPNAVNFNVTLFTESENFDEPVNIDENITVTISTAANNEVDLEVLSPQVEFPGTNEQYTFRMDDLKENDDIERGMSKYGVLFEEFDDSGSQDADRLTIEYPLTQREGLVYIVTAPEDTPAAASGTAFQVARIDVGTAKLASEVSDIRAVNAIVVGGPCANAAAAELMGNPANCAEDFEEGRAMIKLYENGGNVAVLVAGYSAMDTRRAARVLANYEDYDLTGKEVVVSGTTLSDISVTKVA
ncbi:MAG: S-layer protein [Candidatus Woesearchaeota archaeon]